MANRNRGIPSSSSGTCLCAVTSRLLKRGISNSLEEDGINIMDKNEILRENIKTLVRFDSSRSLPKIIGSDDGDASAGSGENADGDGNNHEEEGRGTDASSSSRRRGTVVTTTATYNSNPRLRAADIPYRAAIQALRTYHDRHGDLVLPRRFVIPADDTDYPPEFRGANLASVYDMIWWQSHVRSHPDRVAELNHLGFVWERLQPEWNLVLEALVTYNALNGGSMVVPVSFVVPHDDELWPRATWGIRLGSCVHRIRVRHDFVCGHPDRMQQLNGLGFVWDVSDLAFRKTLAAMKHFARFENGIDTSDTAADSSYVGAAGSGGGGAVSHRRRPRRRQRPRNDKVLRIPSNFVVPSGEGNGWPEELWGFPLGAKCSAIRHKGLYVKNHPERLSALESVGFPWRHGNATLGWLKVVHAAAIYSQMNGHCLDVPQNFVVPHPHTTSVGDNADAGGDERGYIVDHPLVTDPWPWPEQLWGFPLGQRLKDVRLKGAYLKGSNAEARRAQLNALGFVWTPKRGPRRRRGAMATAAAGRREPQKMAIAAR